MSGRVQKTPEGSGKTAKDLQEKTIRVNHARTGAGVGGDHEIGDGEPVRKKPHRSVHATDNAESDIDENVCCMCFESYFNDVTERSGRDWVNCACGHWLHEECAEDHKIDSIGKDRFCHYCFDLLNSFCVVFVAESCLCVCAPSSCFWYNIKLVLQCRAAKAACSGVACKGTESKAFVRERKFLGGGGGGGGGSIIENEFLYVRSVIDTGGR